MTFTITFRDADESLRQHSVTAATETEARDYFCGAVEILAIRIAA